MKQTGKNCRFVVDQPGGKAMEHAALENAIEHITHRVIAVV